jgi:hypothetical protein
VGHFEKPEFLPDLLLGALTTFQYNATAETWLKATMKESEKGDAADRVEQAIYDACAFVAEAPVRGHSRPDLTTRSLRFWTVTRYPCTGQRRPRLRSLPLCTEREISAAS